MLLFLYPPLFAAAKQHKASRAAGNAFTSGHIPLATEGPANDGCHLGTLTVQIMKTQLEEVLLWAMEE